MNFKEDISMQVLIDVPDSLPKEILKQKINEIELALKKEAESLQKKQTVLEKSTMDPWDALDIEAIAVDSGSTDGSINHDHYIYGIPKK